MPEGHLVHRHARELTERFAGLPVAASSPQGRFAVEAAAIDGTTMRGTEAYGKHLFLTFEGDDARVVHVHLGRQGLWLWGTADATPRPSVRLRIVGDGDSADLIAPIVCELGLPALRDEVVARLGPDPLRPDADPEPARRAILSSTSPIGALLLDQATIAGLGNVLRAEVLHGVGIHPASRGDALDDAAFDAIWSCAQELMRRAEREGRIITRRPKDLAPGDLDEVEGRFAYGRETCGRCGTRLEQLTIAGRAIAACPVCQPERVG